VRWWLVAAWALAVVMCGVVLWNDAHFVICGEGAAFELRFSMTFRCFEAKWESSNNAFADLTGTTSGAYADFAVDDQDAEVYDRLSWNGAAVFALAWAAPVLGLVGLVMRHASPAFRHVLLLFAALTPLAAMEFFHAAVAALNTESLDPGTNWIKSQELHATPATWAARIAWGGLAVAAAISWWRWPKPPRATPVDPEVFE
jgi:hypothetical protein